MRIRISILLMLICMATANLAGQTATSSARPPGQSDDSSPTTPARPAPSLEARHDPSPASGAAASFDAAAATQRYLDSVPPDKREKSDAYFEGGYWLQLWSFLYGFAVYALLLFRRFSARMRDLAQRVTSRLPLQTLLYWLQFLVVTTIAFFPLTVYSGFFREHQYGLATQTFPQWLGDFAKGFMVSAVLGGLALVALYAVLRKSRQWWIWGSFVAIGFIMFSVLIGPVYIAPLFNKYTRLADPQIRGTILRMAHANGITASDVYVMDASRQTTRISANVSGMFGTERITLNDNLLNRTSVPEIRAVMGHEIGHYALNHIYKMIIFLGIVIVVAFAFLKWGSDRAISRWGERWRVSSAGDVASLPLLSLLLSIAFFVMTPVTNSIIRIQESEADIYGLNAAQEPEGFAEVSLKLGEYRKLSPGTLEEILLYDHPSGRSRILMAMHWKAAQTESAGEQPPGTPEGQPRSVN